jgi:hypothetical protein
MVQRISKGFNGFHTTLLPLSAFVHIGKKILKVQELASYEW